MALKAKSSEFPRKTSAAGTIRTRGTMSPEKEVLRKFADCSPNVFLRWVLCHFENFYASAQIYKHKIYSNERQVILSVRKCSRRTQSLRYKKQAKIIAHRYAHTGRAFFSMAIWKYVVINYLFFIEYLINVSMLSLRPCLKVLPRSSAFLKCTMSYFSYHSLNLIFVSSNIF